MGNHQPAAIDLLVDVRHKPIDLPGGAVFHLCLPDFGTDFPCEIADGMSANINQRDRPLRECLVELGPVFLLSFPTDDDRRADRCR